MLIWSILARSKPFRNMADNDIIRLVAKETKRPPIPSSRLIPKRLQFLIQSTWKDDAARRPNFLDIQLELLKIRDELEDLATSLPLWDAVLVGEEVFPVCNV